MRAILTANVCKQYYTSVKCDLINWMEWLETDVYVQYIHVSTTMSDF